MPRKSVSKVDWVVTVADSHRTKLAEVADALRAAGLDAPQTLESSGIIIGSAAPDARARLHKVAGVKAVEASGDVQIAPPDADIQ